MDNHQIDKLQSGRELDALIAKEVMGRKVIVDVIFGMMEIFTTDKGENVYTPLPDYSQDLSAAQRVITKMNEMAYHDETAYWRGEDRPEIICKAALRAVFQRKKEEETLLKKSRLRIVK